MNGLNQSKKMLYIMLFAVVLIFLCPQAVKAEEWKAVGEKLTSANNHLRYEVTGEGTIKCIGVAKGYTVSEAKLTNVKTSGGNVYVVTEIDNHAFSKNNDIVKVIIPSTVTTIGEFAFSSCSNLTEIAWSEGLIKIDTSAFAGCSKLQSVVIPNSVNEVGDMTFTLCEGLKSITFGTGMSKIPGMMCHSCSNLQSVVIPEQITVIGMYAFKDTGLNNVEFKGLNILKIGEEAFLTKAGSIPKISAPAGYEKPYAKAIKETLKGTCIVYGEEIYRKAGYDDLACAGAFREVKYHYIPPEIKVDGFTWSVKYISADAFKNDQTIREVVLGYNVSSIGENSFKNCKKLKSVTLGNAEIIGYSAFENDTNLKEILMPASVKEVGEKAFKNCKNLSKVSLGSGIETIYSNCFENCGKLKKITIPDNVKEIKPAAFKGCKKVNEITFGRNLKKIGTNAFMNCKSLRKITFRGKNLKTIGKHAFKGIPKHTRLNYKSIPEKTYNKYKKMVLKSKK